MEQSSSDIKNVSDERNNAPNTISHNLETVLEENDAKGIFIFFLFGDGLMHLFIIIS